MPKHEAHRLTGSWEQSDSLHALRELTEVAARVRPVVSRRAGLSASELGMLEHLSHGPRGPAELAQLLEVSTAASTGIVDRLEQRGHVLRGAHDHDRRRTVVSLTSSGREEVLTHLLPMLQALQELDRGFAADERAVVARYLQGAVDALRRVTDPPAETE